VPFSASVPFEKTAGSVVAFGNRSSLKGSVGATRLPYVFPKRPKRAAFFRNLFALLLTSRVIDCSDSVSESSASSAGSVVDFVVVVEVVVVVGGSAPLRGGSAYGTSCLTTIGGAEGGGGVIPPTGVDGSVGGKVGYSGDCSRIVWCPTPSGITICSLTF
jgi:hypothetical protein